MIGLCIFTAFLTGGLIGGFVAINKRLSHIESQLKRTPASTQEIDYTWAQARRQAIRVPHRTAEARGDDLWSAF